MIYLLPVNGLANRMRAIDSAISLSKLTNQKLNIYWFRYWGINCQYKDLFEPINGLKIMDRDKVPVFFDSGKLSNLYLPTILRKMPFIIHLNPYQMKPLLENEFDFGDLKGGIFFISSYSRFFPSKKPFENFRPIPSLLTKIDQESQDFNEHTIGIHIRRTDNVKSISHSPTSLFEQRIEDQLLTNPLSNFYLASDCLTTKRELKLKYASVLQTNLEIADRNSKEGVQQALVELYTLSRTNKIFGSYWSSYSETAAEITGIENIIIKDK